MKRNELRRMLTINALFAFNNCRTQKRKGMTNMRQRFRGYSHFKL
jgi:hypothetical protein